jgi:serine/threonine protein kinase
MKEVPHIDRLQSASTTVQCSTIFLAPVGVAVLPSSEHELIQCLECVLEALVALHARNLMHRDIRWPNVLRIPKTNEWILIDFDDATICPADNSTASHLTKDSHAPEMFQLGKFFYFKK